MSSAKKRSKINVKKMYFMLATLFALSAIASAHAFDDRDEERKQEIETSKIVRSLSDAEIEEGNEAVFQIFKGNKVVAIDKAESRKQIPQGEVFSALATPGKWSYGTLYVTYPACRAFGPKPGTACPTKGARINSQWTFCSGAGIYSRCGCSHASLICK